MKASAAIVQRLTIVERLERVEIITVRLAPGFLRIISNANPSGGIKAGENAAFGVQPQGYGVANRLAAGPQGRGGPADNPADLAHKPPKTLALWRYRGRYAGINTPPPRIADKFT